MINFTELVDKVDQRNRQNKEAAMAQIQPFFDVMYKKAVYDREQRQQSEQAVQYGKWLGKTYGLPYQELTLDDGSLAPANLQFDAMKAQFEVGKVESVIGQFMKDNKDWIGDATVPEGSIFAKGHWFEEMQKTVAGEKEASERIKELAAVHPSIKEALESEDYKGMSNRERLAVAQSMEREIEAESQARAKAETEARASSRRILEHQVKTDYTQQAKAEAEAGKPTGKGLTVAQEKSRRIVERYESTGNIHQGYSVKVNEGEDGLVAEIEVKDSRISKIKYKDGGYWGFDTKKNKGKGEWVVLTEWDDGLEYKVGGFFVKNPWFGNANKAINEAIKEYQKHIANFPTEEEGGSKGRDVKAWLKSIGASQ